MKRIWRVLALLFLLHAALAAPLARAEGGLVIRPYWSFETGGLVHDLQAGDIDGDGAPEVVVLTSDNILYVLENDGRLAWRYDVEFNADRVMVTDLEVDGSGAEILVAGYGAIMILSDAQRPICVSTVGSSFAKPIYSMFTHSISATDLDGDGRQEVLRATDTGIYSLNGECHPGQAIEHAQQAVMGVWTGDVNGDGRGDIVPTFGPGSDTVSVFEDMASQRPAWQQRIAGEVRTVEGGDVDGDGQAELAVLTSAWELFLLESDGRQVWRRQVPTGKTDIDFPWPGQLLVRDLDGDGRMEIMILTLVPAPVVHVFDGHGRPVWQHRLDTNSTTSDADNHWIAQTLRNGWMKSARLAAGDVNGNGRAEVVIAPKAQEVYLLDAAGRRLAEYRTWQTSGAIAYADLNGDGSGEIILGTETGVQVFGASSQAVWSELWQAAYVPGPVVALDLTGAQDAVKGKVIAASQDGSIYVLNDDGHVLWEGDLKSAVLALSAGDVDGDTRPEVVVSTRSAAASETAGSQLHLLDEGRPVWSVPLESSIHSLAVHDLDGDGRAAIIAGSSSGSRGAVLLLDSAGHVDWQRELDAAVTAVGGDGGQVLAGAQGGRVYRLTADGAIAQVYELGAAVLSLDAGLAATADGRVYRLDGSLPSVVRELGQVPSQVRLYATSAAMLAGGQASLLAGNGATSPGSVDGPATGIAAGDLNGDGETELAVGTEGGGVALFGMTLDQPPMLTVPDLAETRDGYVYSVDVNDPERRAVTVALEIWDPSAGIWLRQADQAARGQARLTWEVAEPFDTWDAGHESRYRFVYDDGGRQRATQEIGGPFTIPTTPPALYYGQRAGLAALLLLVPALGLLIYYRQRAYRRSPVGQAEALLNELHGSPQDALPRLRELARRDPAQLALLSGLADRAAEPVIAEVSQGLHLILTRPELAADGLRAILTATDSQHAGDITRLYALFQAMLEANTVTRVVALRPQLGRPDRSSARPGYAVRAGEDLSGLDTALSDLGRAAEALRNSQRVELAEDKIAYLAQAIETLGRLQRAMPEDVPQPEHNILARVAFNWLAVASNALQDLQGRAQIEVALKTRQVMQASATALALELTNAGRSPASNVSVCLLPGEGYAPQDGAVQLAVLPAGRSELVELPVAAAPFIDQFRAEFSITFDDAERQGKTLAFADMVTLMRPAAAFQPIPNPYAPGTPLAPGSPLFFGRDDLFQFVAENLPGLARQNILVLVGQRRMGKTSFLKQLTARLGEEFLPVYLDGQALGVDPGMPNFFYDLALAIADALAEAPGAAHLPAPAAPFGPGGKCAAPELADFRERPSQTFERDFLPAVLQAIGQRRLLLLFDEFEELEMRVASGRLDAAIFPFLRHLMQHSPRLGFVFVGTHRLEALSADYWSIFFNAALYKHVAFLNPTAARALIVQPVAGYGLAYDDLALDKLLRVTAGHPYFLQLSCHALVNHANRQRRGYLTIQDVNDVLEDIVELGEAHFAFLWEQASPPQRLMLAALTRLAAREVNVTAGQVAELLAERGVPMGVSQVNEALRGLAEQDVVREVAGQPPRYEYKVELLRLWVERYKALEQVMEEAG